MKKSLLLIIMCLSLVNCQTLFEQPTDSEEAKKEVKREKKQVSVSEMQLPAKNLYSVVYNKVNEKFNSIAGEFIVPGDRVLLINSDQIERSLDYRFLPLPTEFDKKDFEELILKKLDGASKLFPEDKGTETVDEAETDKIWASEGEVAEGAEEKGETEEKTESETDAEYVASLYTLQDTEGGQQYILNKDHAVDEVKLRRIIATIDYFKYKKFDSTAFYQSHPYFLEYVEKGFIKSIIENNGKVFERLQDVTIRYDYLVDLLRERRVFNTSILEYISWKDLKESFNVNKVLLYSLHDVIEQEDQYIGFTMSLKFIDIDTNGTILWQSTEQFFSDDFPESRKLFINPIVVRVPEPVIEEKREVLRKKLRQVDITDPIDIVLCKIDDIPIFSNYPVTQEDFAIENSLIDMFTEMEGINVLEKLSKRSYKLPWQYKNAIYYINPFLGGDYTEFKNYYGTRYLMGYRIMWNNQIGINFVDGSNSGINKNIAGVFLKLIDMDTGQILICDFIPFSPGSSLRRNFLYRCFAQDKLHALLMDTIQKQNIISQDENILLINKRMEILKNYLDRGLISIDYLYSLLSMPSKAVTNTNDSGARTSHLAEGLIHVPGSHYDLVKDQNNAQVFQTYHTVYELFRMERGEEPNTMPDKQEVDYEDIYFLAANIIHSWFEDGIISTLVSEGYTVNEKLESLYSRAVVSDEFRADPVGNLKTLSPLLLQSWGENIKKFHNVDKIVYYTPFENTRDIGFLIKAPVFSFIDEYIPRLTYDFEWFLFTVLDVSTGDYIFDENLNLKK